MSSNGVTKKKYKHSSYCCVPQCMNHDREGLSFHSFPSNEKLKKHWETILKLPKPASRFVRVCSEHFVKHDFFPGSNRQRHRLKKNAIPRLKLPKPVPKSKSSFTPKMLKDETKHNEVIDVECRACLQKCREGERYELFKCWEPPWTGMENTVVEDLIKLTHVQILETDKHSKVLCHYCYKMLQKANNFVQIVRRTDEVLKQRFIEESNGEDNYWPKPIQIDKNMDNLYDNVKIKEEVPSDDEYYGHMNGTDQTQEFPKLDIKIEAEEWDENAPVRINGTISLSQLNAEMARLHESPPPSKNEGDENMNSVLTNGDEASGIPSLATKIKDEPLSEDDVDENVAPDLPLECLLCMKPFLSISGLKAHVIAQHSYKTVKRKHTDSLSPEKNEFLYTCTICQRKFETSTDLMVHETCHNKCVCYVCNASFDTFDALSEHRRSCAGEGRLGRRVTLDDVKRPNKPTIELECPHCPETFTDAYYMDIHLEIHHPSNDVCTPQSSDEENMEIEALESLLEEI
ncbi:zinc finger protein weckle-like isoform X1 [Colias croceus]|uniref:zinc finger protein weckle-like isoform X1 n=2 Tax=Colias crocea TaxID=72248 RepID=UPI001E279FFE|nr:zinc finger protein weckle-like isoform X1 [Colias croceus]XP_045507748.1 zinc finger protein weckle-like isoform X1 [Colias croceus]XP_045507756.1 zinc finger protein weckle-like isoform X1 [Colias croceus]